MFTQNLYYVVDHVSQTILGTFYAKNDAMAQKIMKGFDYKKANLDPKDLGVYVDPFDCKVYETYGEIYEKINVSLKPFDLEQDVFDFEEEKVDGR